MSILAPDSRTCCAGSTTTPLHVSTNSCPGTGSPSPTLPTSPPDPIGRYLTTPRQNVCGPGRMRTLLGMRGAYLLAREAELAQNVAHRGRVVGLAIGPLQPVAEIGTGPGRDSVAHGIRSTFYDSRERRPLRLAQTARRMALRAVMQAGKSFSVVARDRVAQRLTFHAGSPCRIRPAHAVQRIGDGVIPIDIDQNPIAHDL